tara:strand:+ start:1264 stop:2106 length:843 start_codon:yes stop_codon:yes gene_type:complete
MKKTLLLTTAIVSFASIANAQSIDAKINRIEKRMIAMEKQVYSGKGPVTTVSADNQLLAETQANVANMQEQNRKLYGKIEELSYAVEKLTEQIKLMSEDFDYRLNELEDAASKMKANAEVPAAQVAKANESTTPVTAKKEESQKKKDTRVRAEVPEKLSPERLYEKAYNYLTLAEYDKSADWFETFIERFPNHKYSDNSYYWLGEIALVQGDARKAVSQFAKGLKTFPNGAKAPANLLKIGVAFKQMSNDKHAKNSWNKLLKDYPNTPEAKKAQNYLKDL